MPDKYGRLPVDSDEKERLTALHERLSCECGVLLRLTITENRTRMISVKGVGRGLSVRLQRVFLDADAAVIGELAEFIRRKGGNTPLIRSFLKSKAASMDAHPRQRRSVWLRSSGVHHDLRRHFDEINNAYFSGGVTAEVTWGKRSKKRAVKRRVLGSFSPVSNIIRLNPILDSPKVPTYFIGFIVYHEMLHAAIGIKKDGSRRAMHTKEFREQEKTYHDYARSMAWEGAHFGRKT